jgi:hypothetical protein
MMRRSSVLFDEANASLGTPHTRRSIGGTADDAYSVNSMTTPRSATSLVAMTGRNEMRRFLKLGCLVLGQELGHDYSSPLLYLKIGGTRENVR